MPNPKPMWTAKLAGPEGTSVLGRCHGRRITDITLSPQFGKIGDALEIFFEDDTRVMFYDDGQMCCEYRYLHTDDLFWPFIGAQFVGAEVREGYQREENGEYHECDFLLVHTTLGDFTIEAHNQHNGYYGGLYIYICFFDKPLTLE